MIRPSSTRTDRSLVTVPTAAVPTAVPTAMVLARRIAEHPAAPLCAAIVGPGGTGKTMMLEALARAYEQAGVEVVRSSGGRGLPSDRLDTGRAVLVDDAHRLDARVLDVLRELAETDAPRLVLAYRPWPRPSALRAVTASIAARRVTLVVSHLDAAAVAARIGERLGATPPDSLVELVHEQSGGLPALVDLVTQALRDTGRFDVARPLEFRRPERVTVSTALAERLRHILDALEPSVQELFEAMAVGAPLEVDILHALLTNGPGPLIDTVGPGPLFDANGPGPLIDADGPGPLFDTDGPGPLFDTVEAARATGLLTEAGALIPFVRNLVLRLTPVLRARELARRLASIELDRGGSVLAAGRRLLGTGASGTRVASVFDAAADEAMAQTPALAAELLAAAVEAGRPPLSVAGRRACAVALVGDLDQALRLADQVIADPSAPDRHLAIAAAATALAYRGLPARSAELHRSLAPAHAVLAVPALVGIGALDDARAVLDAGRPAQAAPSTLLTGAAELLADGMLGSVTGSVAAALSQLARAQVLLEPVAQAVLLPDTPAALTALVAMQCGELLVADTALRRAVAGRHGGRAAQPRHGLLHAWVAMTRGRLDQSRRTLDRIDQAGRRLEPRDELVAAGLAVGLARRENDAGLLAAAWKRARAALVEHPVDLYSLPQLGECAVAAARLGAAEWLAPHLDEADALLTALGDPVLWSAPLHWYRLHTAVAAEDPAAAQHHASALAAGAGAGPYVGVLAAAAASWCQVLTEEIDVDAVQVAARGLHRVGLAWEASHLAGQAGERTTDRRAMAALHACARVYANLSTAGTADVALGSSVRPAAVAADRDAAARPEPAAPVATPHPGDDTDRTDAAAGDPSVLTGRELEIGRLVLAGLTYKQIGQQLFISAKTVEHHVSRIRSRLGVTTRNELFASLRTLTAVA